MTNSLKELAHSGAREVGKQVKKATRRAVTHGKRQLKSSTAELVKTTAADLIKHVPKLIASHAKKRRIEDMDESPAPAPKRQRTYARLPSSAKKGYLSGMKQFGGVRLF